MGVISNRYYWKCLTHWGRVTHICVSKLTIIGSDNGLSPDRRQANVWTNAGLLLIGPLGTNFSEILIEILTFSFKKMRLKVSSAKRQPFCLGLNVLTLVDICVVKSNVTVMLYALLGRYDEHEHSANIAVTFRAGCMQRSWHTSRGHPDSQQWWVLHRCYSYFHLLTRWFWFPRNQLK